jgi:hypothetical protein
MALIFFHYLVRRISWKLIPLFFVGFYLVSQLSFLGRSLFAYGLRDVTQERWKTFLVRGLDPSRVEFGGPFDNLLIVMDAFPGRFDYRYGLSYLEAPLTLFPLALYPDRPVAPSEWLMETFFPGAWSVGAGRGFSLVAESYLNFGCLGPAIVMFLLGIAARSLYNYFRRDPTNLASLLLYSVSLPVLVLAVRADYASVLKFFISACLFPAVLGILLITFIHAAVTAGLGRRLPPSKEEHVVA